MALTSMQNNTCFFDYNRPVIACAWASVASITPRSRFYVYRLEPIREKLDGKWIENGCVMDELYVHWPIHIVCVLYGNHYFYNEIHHA